MSKNLEFMDDETLENHIKAGKIASEVREHSKSIVKPGAKLLDIAEEIEALIRKHGGEPAFPVNLSINELAAHYTPYKNDPTVVPDNAIIKVDVGVHVDGYVADTAHTLCFNEELLPLAEASRVALDNAIERVKPDALLSDVSAAIEEAITSYGFKPVSNLTGHGLERYYLHAEPQVPNVKFTSNYRLTEGQVIAIEPFATNGAGRIKETEPTLIYMVVADRPARNSDARTIMRSAAQYNGLPFAERWLPIESRVKIRIAMKELIERGAIYEYPPLKEIANGMVSQAEHTVIVQDPPIVITK